MAETQALEEFSRWVKTLRGNEKSEAQTFINRLYQAWGWSDAEEAGVIFEKSIVKGSLKGGTGSADAVQRDIALIEMKSRGESLQRHFPQLQRYWFRITPKTQYAVLCNFDEFWIYDFNKQVDEPVDKIETQNLGRRRSGLAFLSKNEEVISFGNNQFEITDRQARSMGDLFYRLRTRSRRTEDFSEREAQRFVLQCVLCMFAEDRRLLPADLFTNAVMHCKSGESTYDILGGLFQEMNTPGITSAGRFKGTHYFNGGLFSDIPKIELEKDELTILAQSCEEDWQNVRPSIFGNIFEASSDEGTRHDLAQHFTSEPDILKVVRPTIIEPWEEKIEQARTIDDLETIKLQLSQYKVCDPACGSGNFLYIAYNSLKDIEAEVEHRIKQKRRSEYLQEQYVLGYVGTNQFFGMDTDIFAVELARVTMMIAKKVAHDRLGLTEKDLPLDNLDKNIIQADALFKPWFEADAYIGNPPFHGGKKVRKALGDEYVDKVNEKYPEITNSPDFCCYWFRLAHDRLKENGRAGLVGTNSVRQGWSRTASLDYIVKNDGYIHNAISSQVWSGDAKVHVSIVNWSKEVPESCVLDGAPVTTINSSLTSSVVVTNAKVLASNKNWGFQGATPDGVDLFTLTPEEAQNWISSEPKNTDVLRPFLTATDLTDYADITPKRWIIDFSNMSIEQAAKYSIPFEHLKRGAKIAREDSRDEGSKHKWWQLHRHRPKMRRAIQEQGGYFAFPRHSKWFIPLTGNIEWLPGDSTTVVASKDFFVLGVLTSSIHRSWTLAQSSTIKSDTRYTHTTCLETFPFPQTPGKDIVDKIRSAMTELDRERTRLCTEFEKGVSDAYDLFFNEKSSRLSRLHSDLDSLVYHAYHWSEGEDVLTKLIELNQDLQIRERQKEKVIGPESPF